MQYATVSVQHECCGKEKMVFYAAAILVRIVLSFALQLSDYGKGFFENGKVMGVG